MRSFIDRLFFSFVTLDVQYILEYWNPQVRYSEVNIVKKFFFCFFLLYFSWGETWECKVEVECFVLALKFREISHLIKYRRVKKRFSDKGEKSFSCRADDRMWLLTTFHRLRNRLAKQPLCTGACVLRTRGPAERDQERRRCDWLHRKRSQGCRNCYTNNTPYPGEYLWSPGPRACWLTRFSSFPKKSAFPTLVHTCTPSAMSSALVRNLVTLPGKQKAKDWK